MQVVLRQKKRRAVEQHKIGYKIIFLVYLTRNHCVVLVARSQKNVRARMTDFGNAEASGHKAEEAHWYAMSAPYRREMKACDMFKAEGLESFLPMRYQIVERSRGRKIRELRPAVPSLIFVRAERTVLQRLKERHGIVQYLCRPEGGRNEPIVVPDAQMETFRKAIEQSMNNFLYFRPGELNLSKGMKVKIVGGVLKGCEGTFMKVKGARNRRLVVMLEGLGAIAAEVDPDYIELI